MKQYRVEINGYRDELKGFRDEQNEHNSEIKNSIEKQNQTQMNIESKYFIWVYY